MKNKIKELRQKHGISQEQLADLLNVSRQTVISIEKGKYNPSLPLAIRLAKVFNTYVEEIFIMEEEDG